MQPAQEFEVIIIGGGITGACIARDCAMRGFKTLVLEKKDFSSGTTATCMGMVHGGTQYVLSEFEMTKESCEESGIIQRLAPHLIFRIPFLHPFFKDPKETMYAHIYEIYDGLAGYKNSETAVMLSAEEARTLEPALHPDIGGALTMDEPGIDVFRLVVANLTAAAEQGAEIRNHAQVLDILRAGDRVIGVLVRDTLTGVEEKVFSQYVVNAAGPWTPQVAALAEIPFKLRPIKGMHLVLDRRYTATGVWAPGAVLLPHETGEIIGIANDEYFQNPDECRVDPNEVEELMVQLEKLLPTLRQARVTRAFAGVRPTLPDEKSKDQRAVSRKHQVFDHEERDGVKGFLTIAGGKMVIGRLMAEDLVNVLCQKTGRSVPCRTAIEPFPGGEALADPVALADEYGVPIYTATRLVYRHGARAARVLEETRRHPETKSNLCECEPVIEAEVRYAIRHEWARTLDDLRRRLRLGMGPCQGFHCTYAAEPVLVDELGIPAGRAHLDIQDFLQSRWKGRYPTMNGIQLRQEEIAKAAYMTVGNYHNPDIERTTRW